jgi:hypothetical protein
MKIIEILEARRNPEKNVKVHVEDQLFDIYSKLSDVERKHTFVHFTRTPKLGLNIQYMSLEVNNPSPIGIYAFPISYIIKSAEESLPAYYHQDYPYIYVYQVDENKHLARKSQPPIDYQTVKSKVEEYVNQKFPDKSSRGSIILTKMNNSNIMETIRQIAIIVTNYSPETYYDDGNATGKSLINCAKEINFMLRAAGYESIQGYGDIKHFESVVLLPKFMKNVQFLQANTDFYQHADDRMKKKFLPKKLDKINPETGRKVHRYPNPFSEPDMDFLINEPQTRTSPARYVNAAINAANQGKTLKNREKGEAMLFSYQYTAGRRRTGDMHEIDSIIQYKEQVLDKLGLSWTRPEYQKMYTKAVN